MPSDNITKRIGSSLSLLFELLRIRNCIIGFLGVLVGASFTYSGEGAFLSSLVIISGFAVFLIIGAGNIINDYFDIEIDSVNKPDKPLPSGKVSKSDALMLSVILFLFGIGMSKSVNQYCFYIATINTIILIIYATYSKRMLFISNLIVSYLVASIFLFGALTNLESFLLAEQRNINLLTVLGVCAFLMTLSREIVKDIEDIKGDKYKYALTIPTKIGTKKARMIASLFSFIAVLFSIIPFFLPIESFNLLIYAIFVGVADIIFLISLYTPEYIAQRIMIGGMIVALFAFLLGDMIPKILS